MNRPDSILENQELDRIFLNPCHHSCALDRHWSIQNRPTYLFHLPEEGGPVHVDFLPNKACRQAAKKLRRQQQRRFYLAIGATCVLVLLFIVGVLLTLKGLGIF